MALTSKQMLENAKKRLESALKELKENHEKLENLENELRVEERIYIEFQEKKDELAEDQKYIVLAVKESEIPMVKNKIAELETDAKILAKKCEVLDRPTWSF